MSKRLTLNITIVCWHLNVFDMNNQLKKEFVFFVFIFHRLNYYSELFQTGLFSTIKVGLSCKMCEERNVDCTHKLKSIQPWSSIARQDKTEKMLMSMPDYANRELKGLISSTKTNFLFKPYITAFAARKDFFFDHDPRVVFIAIDPAGKNNSIKLIYKA